MIKDLTLNEFRLLPDEKIARYVPETIVYSVSGTRRSAVLAGVSPDGDAYAEWSRTEMIRCLKLLFRYGVKNILMPILTPSQFRESTQNYSDHLWRWIEWGLAGDASIAEFKELGWYVNIPFAEFMPQLHTTAGRLAQLERREDGPNLWIFITPAHNQLMDWTLQKIQAHGNIKNVQQAIETVYGAAIQPADIYLDFGKPVVSSDLIPPLLGGVLQCYWNQQPGYSLTNEMFRNLLYDYLVVRKTWTEDKTGRTKDIMGESSKWLLPKTLGLGQKLGPYWYPADQ